jgi:copper/silver efflux system protein
MISSTLLTLIVIPAIFGLVKGFGLPREPSADASPDKGSRGQAAGPVLDCPEAAE